MDEPSTTAVEEFRRALDALGTIGARELKSEISTQKQAKSTSVRHDEDEGYTDMKTTTYINCLGKTFAEAAKSTGLVDDLRNSRSFCTLCYEMLHNDSLLDIGRRTEMYQALFTFLLQIATHPDTCAFFSHPLLETRKATCAQLLTVLASQASVFLQLHRGKQVTPIKRCTDVEILETDESVLMANSIINTVKAVESFVDRTLDDGNYESTPKSNTAYATSSSSSSHFMSMSNRYESPAKRRKTSEIGMPTTIQLLENERADYVPLMLQYRFAVTDMCSVIASGRMSHIYYAEATSRRASASSNPQQRMTRIAKEMATLSTTLPVEFGSSVFLRVDESRMDLIKALIIGPLGTPYANGCFEFDILLPSDYPQRPPYVTLVTTGKGTVSFNPFYSEDGYICLSLFNTSDGPSKDWDPERSTLMQVLVSLQSLVMVAEPYYTDAATERNEEKSLRYTRKVQQNCMRWAILEQLKSPSVVLQDAIRAHFKHKRLSLKQQLQEWLLESPSCGDLVEKAAAALDQL